jgi:hypothetical protein
MIVIFTLSSFTPPAKGMGLPQLEQNFEFGSTFAPH